MRIRRKPDHDVSAYVYRHIRLDKNEVFYIGIGIGYYFQRADQKTKRSKFWHYIADKTEWYSEIMVQGLTREQAELKEIEFIALYGRKKDGGTLCNITFGGDGSFGLRGENSPNFGKKHTPERVANMRKAVIASITPETKRKQREAALKRPPCNEETRKKLATFKGKKHTEESKRKMSDTIRAKLEQKKRNNNMLEQLPLFT
jgi:hypothetical protein